MWFSTFTDTGIEVDAALRKELSEYKSLCGTSTIINLLTNMSLCPSAADG
jgi:hypothetical protein